MGTLPPSASAMVMLVGALAPAAGILVGNA